MTLEKYPESAYWNYRAGRFALESEDFTEAEKLLEKSWKISQEDGGDAATFDYYLECLYRSGKHQELLSYASKYIDTQYAPVAYAQMAQTQFKMGNASKSVEHYRTGLEKSGTSESLMLAMAKSYLIFNKVDSLEEIRRKIDAITPVQILEIANEVLDEKKLFCLTYM